MPTLEELRIQQAMQQAQAENALAAAEAEQAKAAAAQQAVQQVSPTNTPAPETTVTVETPAADNTPAPSAAPTSSDQLKTTQDNYNQLNADALKQTQEINAANAKMWSDLINEQYERKRQQEQEMKAQEKANTLSSMATGTTELAAGIINLLSVGGLHASNQQYKSYSQDWMRKAEQDLKEHRARRDNLQATLDRLKLQQQQVATAGRVEEMKLKQQQAREALNIAIQNEQLEYQRQKDAAEQERKAAKDAEDAAYREAQIRHMQNADAQSWAHLQNDMVRNGWVPDKSAPGGYRFDPERATAIATAKKGSGGGSTTTDAIPILDKDGNVNIAKLRPHELETVLLNARSAIASDLGDKESVAFEKEFRKAMDDKARNAVLMKWMGKSETCGDMIRQIDENYQGLHGLRDREPVAAPAESTSVATKPTKGESTLDKLNSL